MSLVRGRRESPRVDGSPNIGLGDPGPEPDKNHPGWGKNFSLRNFIWA